MILTENGVLKLMQRIKSFIASQLNTKANSVHTHTISEIDDLSSLQMGGYSKSEVDTLLNGKSDTSHTHSKSQITDFPTLSTVATSGDYDDLSNKPTIPIVDSALSSTSTNALQNKVINTELSKKANTSHTHTVSDVTDFPTLATVATSGSYNDLSNKPTTMTPTSHTHGNITNDGKIGSNANKPLITTTGGTVTTGSFGTSANTFCEGNDSRLSDARTPTAHTHTVSDVTDFPSLATVATSGSYNDLDNKPTIPTVNNATLTIQKNGTTVKTFTANASSNVTANITVPTKVSELDNDSNYLTTVPNLDASKITSGTIDIARLPAGALERLVTVTNKTARFALTTSTVQVGDVVKQTDTGVMYYVVDTANLNSEDGYSEFTAGSATSVPWSGVTGKPSSYTPSSHTHGNITNAGAIGSTANKPLITTTNGVITTGSFGTTANTFCQGNDSRLSDARTPTAHTHSASDITSGLATVATSGSYNDLSNKPTIPTVNNATLTIQKNGTTVKTFTANASSNVTANITVPTKVSELTNDSCIPLSGTYNITGTDFFKDANTSFILISGGHAWNTGAHIELAGGAKSENPGTFTLQACKTDGIFYRLIGYPNGTLTWGSKNLAMQEDTVPRSGGAVLGGTELRRTTDNEWLSIHSASNRMGAYLNLESGGSPEPGLFRIHARTSLSDAKTLCGSPDGTFTWNGQPIQYGSDQRLKQQIDQIDDKLLDAWEDVDLVQFKYNDAVDQKKDNARLHTGYVVQQIDNACKSHGVDVSAYGLYCHEQYPEETEEVEVEQADGTKTKERKVIREASEHYSLRYTEVYAVECMYLRREVSRLKQQNENLEQRLKMLEQSVK